MKKASSMKGREKYCLVPMCHNTFIKTPGKLFITIPTDSRTRSKWLNAIRRDLRVAPLSDKSGAFVCEDHFDMDVDVVNIGYVRWSLSQGYDARMILRRGVIPHKFECQSSLRKVTASRRKSAVIEKLNRKRIIDDLLKSSEKNDESPPELASPYTYTIQHNNNFPDKPIIKIEYFNSAFDNNPHIKSLNIPDNAIAMEEEHPWPFRDEIEHSCVVPPSFNSLENETEVKQEHYENDEEIVIKEEPL